jgi:hypothetical protein
MTDLRARRAGALAAGLALALACGDGVPGTPRQGAADSAGAAPDRVARAGEAVCFVTARSVLARAPGSPAPGPTGLRGWIRLEQLEAADSGPARLADSDGRALAARWRRPGSDSVVVAGFDDFLRVEMRLRVHGHGAAGVARASSDAALERDPGGRVREFRREWRVAARRTPCEGMPRPPGGEAG